MHLFHKHRIFLLLTGVLLIASCKKFVEIAPPIDQVTTASVFDNDQTATAAVLGLYSRIEQSNEYFLNGNFSLYCGLSADELVTTSPNGDADPFLQNGLTADSYILEQNFWTVAYQLLYQTNACIEGLGSSSLTPALQQQLLGEAKFIRALIYLHLTNCFGGVPLEMSTDYRINQSLPRADSAAVYAQIVADLGQAQQLLSATYPDAPGTRPNQWAATALLARVYLYQGNWAAADSAATAVIGSGAYSLVSDLNGVFLAGSTEAILQLVTEIKFFNTSEGNSFIPQFAFLAPKYTLNQHLLDAFEPDDQRRANWVRTSVTGGNTYNIPFKYKLGLQFADPPKTEYNMLLRLSEQYLIRAEAEAQQNKLTEAAGDLNLIRGRAGLLPTDATDQAGLLAAIAHERQVELFAENGHRWFDLKRTGAANTVLAAEKTGWSATDALYPIPLTERQLNPHLTQNEGY